MQYDVKYDFGLQAGMKILSQNLTTCLILDHSHHTHSSEAVFAGNVYIMVRESTHSLHGCTLPSIQLHTIIGIIFQVRRVRPGFEAQTRKSIHSVVWSPKPSISAWPPRDLLDVNVCPASHLALTPQIFRAPITRAAYST